MFYNMGKKVNFAYSMIKFGFLIKNDQIFDTKIMSYKLNKIIDEGNIIYTMTPSYYKRLYLFEALLFTYSVNKVFQILKYNKILKINRDNHFENEKLHSIANMSVIYDYPPTYLTKRKFIIYKKCQRLKQKLD